jgi:hypothetical protein
MPDIMIQCPVSRQTVPTGLTTEIIVFESLPIVSLPLLCPSCGKVHAWRPAQAWVNGIVPEGSPKIRVRRSSSQRRRLVEIRLKAKKEMGRTY